MTRLYDAGWESPAHYSFWAQAFVPDFEADFATDPVRLEVARWVLPRNLDTAVSCLLNQWDRDDEPAAWDETRSLLEGWRTIEMTDLEFENAATAYLADLARRVESPRTRKRRAEAERDRAQEIPDGR